MQVPKIASAAPLCCDEVFLCCHAAPSTFHAAMPSVAERRYDDGVMFYRLSYAAARITWSRVTVVVPSLLSVHHATTTANMSRRLALKAMLHAVAIQRLR